MHSFRDVIDAWPTPADFAADLGVPYVTANLMRQRNSIHARHWKGVVESARTRKIKGISLDLLASFAAKDTRRSIRTRPEHPERVA
jgi:hypothetical protein